MASPSSSDSLMALGPVFVISRRGDHSRKHTITPALEAHGIEPLFFDAVMGADLNSGELDAAYDAEAALRHKTIPRRMHPSNIACSISHQRLYDELLRRGLPSAVVLEDDARPIPERFGSVGVAVAELPPDWDLLYLGIRGHRLPPAFFGLKRALVLPFAHAFFPRRYRLTPREAARLYLRPFSAGLYRAGYHQGTHAYAISAKGAAVVRAHTPKVDAPADAILGTLILEDRLQAFALKEDLFTTTGEPSQIASSLGGA